MAQDRILLDGRTNRPDTVYLPAKIEPRPFRRESTAEEILVGFRSVLRQIAVGVVPHRLDERRHRESAPEQERMPYADDDTAAQLWLKHPKRIEIRRDVRILVTDHPIPRRS